MTKKIRLNWLQIELNALTKKGLTWEAFEQKRYLKTYLRIKVAALIQIKLQPRKQKHL